MHPSRRTFLAALGASAAASAALTARLKHDIEAYGTVIQANAN